MPFSILGYFLLLPCDRLKNNNNNAKVKALVLIEPETFFCRLFVHRTLWLSNTTFVLTIWMSEGIFSSHCFRFTTRSNCHSSSSGCLCLWHSVGSRRCCGMALWGWSCHHQWNGCWRYQTHGRDCHRGNCAQCRPLSEITLEVLNDSLGPFRWRRWGLIWIFFFGLLMMYF